MAFHAPIHRIGASGTGTPFTCFGGNDGRLLERIIVWVGGSQIKAIRVWLTDSEPMTFGEPSGPPRQFDFQPGERMTKLSLWGNGAGTRAGWIYFETSSSRTFDYGMTSWDRKQEYPIDVASGICIGVAGRSGEDIDQIAFVFLKPIATSVLMNVSYPTLAFDTQGIVPVTLDAYNDQNDNATTSRDWVFAGSRAIKETSSWSVTAGLAVHSTITVKAGIPSLATVGVETGWEVSASATHAASTERTRTLSWSQSGTLAPGQWISLRAVTREGTLSVPYEASMEVTLRDGVVFRYALRGVYAGVAFSHVQVSSQGTRRGA